MGNDYGFPVGTRVRIRTYSIFYGTVVDHKRGPAGQEWIFVHLDGTRPGIETVYYADELEIIT